VAICDLPDGARCYARADDRTTIDRVSTGEWVGAEAQVSSRRDGINVVEI
jgi:hypothetical protein